MVKDFGLLQVYTGNGKGKTTAALGVVLRAVGAGARTVILAFMKDDSGYGEVSGCKYLPGVTLEQVGRNDFVNFRKPDPLDLKLAQAGWEKAQRYLLEGQTDLLVLDELNLVLAHHLIDVDAAVKFLQAHKQHGTEIICTGRDAPPKLLAIADLITEMREVRHYYERGIGIRDGIDH